MKAAVFSLAAFCVLAVVANADTADKTLQNLKGDVSFVHGTAAKKSLAPSASINLADRDYAITGIGIGAVTLPDSSVVTVGNNSKVQLAAFNQANGSSAKFIIGSGQTRFEVRHPKGAKANYTFVTPTATIAVRGTQGDIASTADSLQVNVYEVCDPALPVEVTAKNGETFEVPAGKAFVGKIVGGILQGQVDALTQQMIDKFNDIGVPTSAQAALAVAQTTASGAIESATGNNGIGDQVVSGLGGLFNKKKAAATPAPSATCS